MAPDDPPTGRTDDVLHALEDRLERASKAAERLIAEAAETIGNRPPPAGWQQPAQAPAEGRSDADVLLDVVRRLRELVPPELQRRLAEALRELLLAVRALIDWYLERVERKRAEPVEVQDIPIL
jgi:hypothetical protein